VSQPALPLNASEAAKQLGVSAKALRIYEERGLLTPERTVAGYRMYSVGTMARAAEIVALRSLGLSLAQVARVLAGDSQNLDIALAAHESALQADVQRLERTIAKVRHLRANLARGVTPGPGGLARELNCVLRPSAAPSVAFELPWPWGGERFELTDIRPINYIVGPLGSGKTRFAERLAVALPGAVFLALDRVDAEPLPDPSRVEQTLTWLVDEGASVSPALLALLTGLEAEGPSVVVVDMVEQGLDQPTQEALIAHLRQRARAGARTLFLMTRSSSILDVTCLGEDEAILFCPANHSVPFRVGAYPGGVGCEAVAMCLASPEVRARTAGMVAHLPGAVPPVLAGEPPAGAASRAGTN
jgi:DNA-binding transcriptional MerR regulator